MAVLLLLDINLGPMPMDLLDAYVVATRVGIELIPPF